MFGGNTEVKRKIKKSVGAVCLTKSFSSFEQKRILSIFHKNLFFLSDTYGLWEFDVMFAVRRLHSSIIFLN